MRNDLMPVMKFNQSTGGEEMSERNKAMMEKRWRKTQEHLGFHGRGTDRIPFLPQKRKGHGGRAWVCDPQDGDRCS